MIRYSNCVFGKSNRSIKYSGSVEILSSPK
jgi:hypothetical protein